MKSKKLLIFGIIIMIISLVGASLAWLVFYQESSNRQLISGNLYVTFTNGARPVVSPKLGTQVMDDGDGTPTNPYIVKYE